MLTGKTLGETCKLLVDVFKFGIYGSVVWLIIKK